MPPFYRATANENKADWSQPLSDEYPTLAEVLYTTRLLNRSFLRKYVYVTPEWGLGVGFTHFARMAVQCGKCHNTVYGKKLAPMFCREWVISMFRPQMRRK